MITVLAVGLQAAERRAFGRTWLESLVLAILLGAALRTAWTPGERWRAGIEWSAKVLLEVGVVLLGASLSATTLVAAGPLLPVGIAGVVAIAIVISYGLGRLLGLSHRLAVLVACGNSICGNSAIAAVAPVIGADGEDVSAAIAFTAVLGIGVVLSLPLLGTALHMRPDGFGAFVGLTVYAVPQVLAAAAPLGAVAVRFGMLVKLIRVLMLGPVCCVLSLLSHDLRGGAGHPASAAVGESPEPSRSAAIKFVPWFIVGFIALLAARSLAVIPEAILAPLPRAASLLTVISMAALGLGTDLRLIAQAGGRVTVAVVGSLLILGVVSVGLLRLLRLG